MASAQKPKPPGAKKWGTCPGCGEYDWLFEYEGGPNDLMCEGCIDEFHAAVHDAEDAMAEMSETDDLEEWTEQDYEEPCGGGP